eukprot:2237944-Alexandrium_andersonii.AAC.1
MGLTTVTVVPTCVSGPVAFQVPEPLRGSFQLKPPPPQPDRSPLEARLGEFTGAFLLVRRGR